MRAREFLRENRNNEFVHKYIPWVAEQLGIQDLPKINLIDQPVDTSFGGYNPETKSINLVTAGRHPVDVLRTLAHELTHYRQDTEGKLEPGAGETGTPQENEANSEAGIIMRDFAQENPEYFGLHESTEPVMIGKIEGTGKIVQIIRKQHSVPFSTDKDWLLVDVDPAKGNRGIGIKWIPASTRFSWVRPYRGTVDEDSIDMSKTDNKSRAHAWIERVYDRYPAKWQNNHVMTWGEGDDQQLAFFELTPSTSKKDAVEVKWFQAYPLRQGVGSRAMRELQDLAREDGIALTLYPWDKGQVSQAKLTKFYKGQGFQPTVKGAKNMIWSPEGVAENFADGKGPGRPGDSVRHGIPKKATMAELEKASHAKGRKGQLARWQLNMRRGHKK
jgi:hypothetical protein